MTGQDQHLLRFREALLREVLCCISYAFASYLRPIKYIHIYVADGTTSTTDFTGLEKYKNIFIIQGQDDYYPSRKVPPCSSPVNDVAATDEVTG